MRSTLLSCMGTRRFVWLVVAAQLCALCVLATDWPQFRGPHGNLTTPDEAPNAPLRVLWRVGLPSGLTYGSVAVAQGRVFTLTARGCDAFDAKTGQLLWTSTNGPGVCHSTPTVLGNRVYTLDVRATLCCRDVTNGTVIWTQPASN